MQTVFAYIGLGSNLYNPKLQIVKAIEELHRLSNSNVIEWSSLYASKPMGPKDQPDFINAVVKISTALPPEELLLALHKIEDSHDRKRDEDRWGPRTLDLDILLYGEQCIDSENLQIPHSGIADREFVLIPLQEIETDLIIPGKGELSDLVNQIPPHELIKIET